MIGRSDNQMLGDMQHSKNTGAGIVPSFFRRPSPSLRAIIQSGLLAIVCAFFIYPVNAQIAIEGFGGFEQLSPYLLDRSLHRADDVRIDVYWGGVLGEKWRYHDRVLLRFRSDSLIAVDYGHSTTDSLVRHQDEWVSYQYVPLMAAVERTAYDSAGVRIIRERYLPPNPEHLMLRSIQTDSMGTRTCTRWEGPHSSIADTIMHGTDDVITTVTHHSTDLGTHHVTTSTTQMAEVIPGHRFPTLRRFSRQDLTVWTYQLDHKGRLVRADQYSFDTGAGQPSEHDWLIVRYRK